MNKNDKIFVDNWTETRKKGNWNYNIKFGSIFGILASIVGFFFSKDYDGVNSFLSQTFLIKLVVYLLVGIFVFAPVLWWLYESRYKKLTKEK